MSDQQVSDQQVSDQQVSDQQVSDQQVSDQQVSDQQVSDYTIRYKAATLISSTINNNKQIIVRLIDGLYLAPITLDGSLCTSALHRQEQRFHPNIYVAAQMADAAGYLDNLKRNDLK